jgi:PTS system nitrogen regulatory IIA component
MTLLTDYLQRADIMTHFQAPDKAGALEALCRFAAERHGLDYETILEVAWKRERLGSTALGGRVALPHGQAAGVEKPVLTMALSPEGVDFDSADGLPVRVFVLLLTPPGLNHREHLAILARLGALFKSPAAVAEVLTAETPADVYAFLLRRGE